MEAAKKIRQSWRGDQMPLPHLDAGHNTAQFNVDHVYLITQNREKDPPRTDTYLAIIGETSSAQQEQLAEGAVQSDVDIEYAKAQRRNKAQGLGPFKSPEAKKEWAASMAIRYEQQIKDVEVASRRAQGKRGVPDPKERFLLDYNYDMEVDSLSDHVKWTAAGGEKSMMGHTELSDEQKYQEKEDAKKRFEKANRPDPRKMSALRHQDVTSQMSSHSTQKYYARRAKMKGIEKQKMREQRELGAL
jgi:hypothetical protein